MTNQYCEIGKRLLDWNREKLTAHSNLEIGDIDELFAPEFKVIANERTYDANHQNYFEFLNHFRSTIESIEYDVQEWIPFESGVVMPLTATVYHTYGNQDIFVAIMMIKCNGEGKIVHWQEVYTKKEV